MSSEARDDDQAPTCDDWAPLLDGWQAAPRACHHCRFWTGDRAREFSVGRCTRGSSGIDEVLWYGVMWRSVLGVPPEESYLETRSCFTCKGFEA